MLPSGRYPAALPQRGSADGSSADSTRAASAPEGTAPRRLRAEARTHAPLWRNSHATLCAQVPTHLWEPTLLTGGLAAVLTTG